MSEKKYKITCTLPHAATEINGVSFTDVEGGLIAENISAREALHFKKIPGYEVVLMGKGENPHEGDHQRVLDGVKKMNVTEIKAFLKAEPAAWNEVLTLEEQRSDPRQSVLEAVKAAKESLQAD
ncbi:MAG TPA: hypothetical protein ENJ08_12225 [Gammaproteobacteria bacterium]|nr:hypothetical protein [Gammaproteobacteria bacterium]